MTIGELAARMDQGFPMVDQKLDAIDHRFAPSNSGSRVRFNGSKQLEALEKKFDTLEKKVNDGFKCVEGA